MKKTIINNPNHLLILLQEGTFEGIKLGDSQDEIIKKLGEPEYVENYKKEMAYYHYYDVRFALTEKLVVGIDFIINEHTNCPFDPIYEFEFSLGKKMRLSNLFVFLFAMSLDFDIDKAWSNREYLNLIINKNKIIYFDLYKDEIYKIGYFFGSSCP